MVGNILIAATDYGGTGAIWLIGIGAGHPFSKLANYIEKAHRGVGGKNPWLVAPLDRVGPHARAFECKKVKLKAKSPLPLRPPSRCCYACECPVPVTTRPPEVVGGLIPWERSAGRRGRCGFYGAVPSRPWRLIGKSRKYFHSGTASPALEICREIQGGG